LEKAQELAPNLVVINMIEAFIYVYSGRFEDARLILDYLEDIEPNNLFLMRAEIGYWQGLGKLDEAVQWYHKAIDSAETVPRKLRLRTQLADCYLQFGDDDKALEMYQKAAHFSKEDPWLWHNMSIAYYNKEAYKEAAHYNKLALSIADIPEIKEMTTVIRSKLGTGGLVNRLLGL
jgi:tetratricopeptide (TPR) repeat protein